MSTQKPTLSAKAKHRLGGALAINYLTNSIAQQSSWITVWNFYYMYGFSLFLFVFAFHKIIVGMKNSSTQDHIVPER